MSKITENNNLKFIGSTLSKLDDKIALLHGALIDKDINKKDAATIAKKLNLLKRDLESIIDIIIFKQAH